MQIDAVIEHGQVKLLEPINLKHGHVNIKLIIPDSEVIKTSELKGSNNKVKKEDNTDSIKGSNYSPQLQEMMNDIDKILNDPIDDTEQVELTINQKDREKSFKFRQQLRNEQGRIN